MYLCTFWFDFVFDPHHDDYFLKYFGDRKDYNVMKHNFAGQPFMKDEIWAVIKKDEIRQSKRPRQYIKGIFRSTGQILTRHLQIYIYRLSKKPRGNRVGIT